MEFFNGFAWPVPVAFSAAVAACRFELGDVLFDDARAYEAWTAAASVPKRQLQVLDPPKSARAVSSDGESNRVAANWASPVVVAVWDAGRAREVHATQGRLFSCLWRGDPAWLDAETAAPEPPLLLRDLHGALPSSLARVRERLGPSAGDRDTCVYLMAVDRASDSSRVKARAVHTALREAFACERLELGPAAAGVERAADFHPALTVDAFAMRAATEEQVEACLKAALYDATERKTDRFSLRRHGLLARAD